MGFLFLNSSPLNEADESAFSIDESGGDNVSGDKAGEDDTGEDNSPTEGEDQSNEEDVSDIESEEDSEGDSADDGNPEGNEEGIQPSGSSSVESLLIRKKRELFEYFEELLGSAENLNKFVSEDSLSDSFDTASMSAINVIRNTTNTSIKILHATMTEDFSKEPYENLLYLYNRHLSTIKLASEIFEEMRNIKSSEK